MEDPTLDAKAEQFKNKGNDEFKRANYNKAIEYYTESLKLKPNDTQSLYRRGRSFEEIKQFQNAIKDYKRMTREANKKVEQKLKDEEYIRELKKIIDKKNKELEEIVKSKKN